MISALLKLSERYHGIALGHSIGVYVMNVAQSCRHIRCFETPVICNFDGVKIVVLLKLSGTPKLDTFILDMMILY